MSLEGGAVVATTYELVLNAMIREQTLVCLRQQALVEQALASYGSSVERLGELLKLADEE